MKNLFTSLIIALSFAGYSQSVNSDSLAIPVNQYAYLDFSPIDFSPIAVSFVDSKGVEVWIGVSDELSYIDESQEWAIYEYKGSLIVNDRLMFIDAYDNLCLPLCVSVK